MAKLPGLVRRGAVYYYRRRVPLDVREAFGRNEVMLSLDTTDRQAASDAWLKQRAKWEDVFKLLRSAKSPSNQIPGPEMLEEPVALSVLRGSRVTRMRAIRRARGNHAGLCPLDTNVALGLARAWFSDKCERQLFRLPPEDVEEALMECYEDKSLFMDHPSSPPALQAVQLQVDVLLDERQLGGFPGEEAYERLCEYLSRAMLELALRRIDYLRREFRAEGYDHLFQGKAENSLRGGPVMQDVVGGITVKEAKDQFQTAKVDGRKDLKERTQAKMRTGLELVVEFFGPDTSLATIDAAQCEAFQAFLQKLPPNFTKVRNGLSLQEIAEVAVQRGARGLMRATRESYFAPLRQMLAWAKKKRLIDENPALDVTEGRMVPGDEGTRHSFTPAQLQQLFNAPLYRGCVDDGNGFNTPGSDHPRRGRFWLPLLGLFSGARLGELCQMQVDDVMHTPKGTPFIRIHGEGVGMSVKNENSWRSLPIHPQLSQIGFLDFVKERRELGEVKLFAELLVEGRSAGYRFSKLFNTFRKAVGVTSPGVCFHSFRHTFRDALRLCHTDIEVVEALGGWSNRMRTSSRYGEGQTMDALFDSISKVNYEGLDLAHLYSKT